MTQDGKPKTVPTSPRTAVGKGRVNKAKIQVQFEKYMKHSIKHVKDPEMKQKRNYKEFAKILVPGTPITKARGDVVVRPKK